MKFALLMYDNVKAWRESDEVGRLEISRRHDAFVDLLKDRNTYLGGLGYEVMTVRNLDTSSEVADGPHAVGDDQLGGFYLVEAESLEEALELAKSVPAPTVEVRPIAE